MKALIAIAALLLAGCALQDTSQHQYYYRPGQIGIIGPDGHTVVWFPWTDFTPLTTITEPVESAPQVSTSPTVSPLPKITAEDVMSGPVWVNTRSGVFHYPGTRWYGNTVEGKFMSEKDAIIEGDRPAMNGQ